jgi:phage-related protein
MIAFFDFVNQFISKVSNTIGQILSFIGGFTTFIWDMINIIPSDFLIITTTCLTILLAIILYKIIRKG